MVTGRHGVDPAEELRYRPNGHVQPTLSQPLKKGNNFIHPVSVFSKFQHSKLNELAKRNGSALPPLHPAWNGYIQQRSVRQQHQTDGETSGYHSDQLNLSRRQQQPDQSDQSDQLQSSYSSRTNDKLLGRKKWAQERGNAAPPSARIDANEPLPQIHERIELLQQPPPRWVARSPNGDLNHQSHLIHGTIGH